MEICLEGKNIGLRGFNMDDILSFHDAALESVDHVYEFLPWCHPDYSLDESAAWVSSRPEAWEKAEEYSFIIYSLKDQRLLGSVAINQINPVHLIGNMGYWVRKSALNQGVAHESILLLKEFGFNELGLNRIEIVTEVNNQPSRRVAEKAGGQYEGVLHNRLLNKDRCVDAAIYGLF